MINEKGIDLSKVPSIEAADTASILPLPSAIAWSVKLNASRILPFAALANSCIARGSLSICSNCKICFSCSAINDVSSTFKCRCKQRDKIVIGNFCGSVVANKNLTCSGGSSNVFNKALKLLRESIWTSSIK